MVKEEVTQLLGAIAVLFPNFAVTSGTVGAWYLVIRELDFPDAIQALTYYAQEEKFPPQPADIFQRAKTLKRAASGEITPEEAWTKGLPAAASSSMSKENFYRSMRSLKIPETQIGVMLRAFISLGIERLRMLDLEGPDYAFARRDFLGAYKSMSAAAEKNEAVLTLGANPELKNLLGNTMIKLKAIA